jgi:hypothetical protein
MLNKTACGSLVGPLDHPVHAANSAEKNLHLIVAKEAVYNTASIWLADVWP